MLDRFEHERNHGTHRTHGRRPQRKTAEDPLSFSVCSEYSVVEINSGAVRWGFQARGKILEARGI
jgi:hypothetical protein